MKLFDQKQVEGEVSSTLGKYGFLLILLCLTLSMNASAQSNGAIQKGTAKVTLDGPQLKTKPLIVLNDRIYKGTIESINSDEIANITVLKGNTATTKYGSQASDGAIEIRTKNNDGSIFKNVKTVSPYSIGKDSTADKNNIKH